MFTRSVILVSLIAVLLLSAFGYSEGNSTKDAVNLNRELCIQVTKRIYDQIAEKVKEKEGLYGMKKEEYEQLAGLLKTWKAELDLVNRILEKSHKLRETNDKGKILEMLVSIKKQLEKYIAEGGGKLAELQEELDKLMDALNRVKKELEKALTRLNTCMFIEMTLNRCYSGNMFSADVALLDKPTYKVHFKGKDMVLLLKGNNPSSILTDEYIPIDTSKKYRLSCEAISLGKELSKIFVGIANYDENKKFIDATKVFRVGNALTIAEINDQIINVKEEIQGWGRNTEIAGQRSIAFYYDGNTNHLYDDMFTFFDDYFAKDESQGAFKSANGHSIHLNKDIPQKIRDKIKMGVTKIMNHSSGNSFQYIATNGAKIVPRELTKYTSNIITGEAFGAENQYKHFRPTTKYARILILPNHRQEGDDYEFAIKNIQFEEVF